MIRQLKNEKYSVTLLKTVNLQKKEKTEARTV